MNHLLWVNGMVGDRAETVLHCFAIKHAYELIKNTLLLHSIILPMGKLHSRVAVQRSTAECRAPFSEMEAAGDQISLTLRGHIKHISPLTIRAAW